MRQRFELWFRQVLSAPVFEDEEKTRQARLLNIILLLTIPTLVVYIGASTRFVDNRAVVLNFAVLLSVIVLWIGVQRGYVKTAGWITLIFVWSFVTLNASIFGGVRDSSYIAYVPIILIAGLILGRWISFFVALISIGMGFWLAYAETNGLIPPDFDTSYQLWLDQSLNIVLISIVFFLALQSLQAALAQGRQNEQALVAINRNLENEIAERTQAEVALRESEARFRAIAEAIPIPIYITSQTDNTIVYASQMTGPFIGLASSEDLIGRNIREFYDDPTGRDKLLEILSREGIVRDFEVEAQRVDGTTFWVSLTAHPIEFEGQPALLSSYFDITQRKLDAQKLQDYAEHLEELVAERTVELEAEIVEHKRTAGILNKRVGELEVVAQVSRATSTMLDSNLLLQTVVNLTKEHFQLSHVHVGLLDEESKFIRLAVSGDEIGRQLIAENSKFHLEKDQSLATLAARTRQSIVINDVDQEPNYFSHPLLKAVKSELVVPMIVGERLVGVLAFQSNQLNRFSDADVAVQKTLGAQVAVALENARRFEALQQTVLQLQETQDRLIRQEKLAVLGQLAGSIAHELRNPLSVIVNSIYFLQMTQKDADETTQEYFDIIASRVNEANKIVTDLLNLSRTRQAERRDVQINELIDNVVARCPVPTDIIVIKHIPPELPTVFIDLQQIQQVLINLITNAYQAMPTGGNLTIKAQAVTDEDLPSPQNLEGTSLYNAILLTFTDTGHGMSLKIQNKIFEPLYTTKAKGIGLGLAVSKNLVGVNGGKLEMESQEGQGSTFKVILPTFNATLHTD